MSYCYTYVDFHGSAQIRYPATTRGSRTVSFPVLIAKIYVKIQKMQPSHSLAPHEETTCSNGNVTSNRGGNCLEGKHTLTFVKL